MRYQSLLVLALVLVTLLPLFSQEKPAPKEKPSLSQQTVDPRQRFERLFAIVPMTGAGTPADPRRPMGVPAPSTDGKRSPLSYTFVLSDDGKFALCEFVAKDPKDLAAIKSISAPGAQLFERDKAAKGQIETAFKALRKDFDVQHFGLSVD